LAEEKKDGSEEPSKQEERESGKGGSAEQVEISELKDRFLRLAAEFDNYKKRTSRDLDLAKKVGKAELMKRLVSVLDEFELALNAKGLDEATAKGIELVYSNFLDALKSEGLTTVDTKGKFDPFKHEIVLTKNCDEEEGKIVEVVRKGYALGEILIRPASVVVSKKCE